jgi:hypothetical protein
MYLGLTVDSARQWEWGYFGGYMVDSNFDYSTGVGLSVEWAFSWGKKVVLLGTN